uniref:Uncharacterized protein n=1 Tax=Chromera velia CCMP2878 TaxID=1169474 RepID=A0A0K6S8A8_9ALVE|eukprot:Cvel_25096.t1-p1 / transcript=Cvel_25096.t1 / gene=Cvel_25096 / organism=Chromera_velia_CCMP2878 / gene_product=hypothetical protein / transcript_product=hypothetical protein / location=Cvel_scaffold2798:10908-12027(-) / protein_length=237 / sequence_SO=supercontig / SO=protein_coding / is_pseudo=false
MKGTEDPDKAKMKEREHPELPSTMASLIKLPAEEFADAVAGQVATVKAVCSRLLSSEEAGCPSFSAACCAPSRSHGRARGQGRGPPIGSRRAADMCGRGTPSVSSEICKMGSTRAETFDDDFSEACSENEKHSPEDALGTSHPLTRCQSLFASAWQWQDSLGDCLDVSEQHAEEQSRHCRLSLFSDPELRSLISSDAPQARRGVSSSSSACGSALEGEREEEDLSDAEENFVRRETM